MDTKEYERLYARILFNYQSKDGEQGREIMYAYNRQVLDSLSLAKSTWDDSKFLEVGKEITLEGRRYKIISINFKLEPKLWDMSSNYGINVYSPTEPTDFNCQIGVFVEPLD